MCLALPGGAETCLALLDDGAQPNERGEGRCAG